MITRAPRPDSNFYILDKAISGDKRLSWAARGVLIFLLGKPDHWTVSPAALTNETKGLKRGTGRDGIYAILNELKEVGYLQVSGMRDQTGSFAGTDYLVTETPGVVFHPHTAQPDTAQPYPANPPQVSIEGKQELKKKTIARSCVLPDDFTPNETALALAAEKCVNVADELAAFVDHHSANGSTFIDWQAAFRTWTRNAAKFAKRDQRGAPARSTAPQAESFAERDARNGRERWSAMTGREWPADELPGAAKAGAMFIDVEANEIKRLSK